MIPIKNQFKTYPKNLNKCHVSLIVAKFIFGKNIDIKGFKKHPYLFCFEVISQKIRPLANTILLHFSLTNFKPFIS